jgi:hypothetical protein
VSSGNPGGNPASGSDPSGDIIEPQPPESGEYGLVDRFVTGSTVVFIWAAFNALLAFILVGFTVSGLIGGASRAGPQGFIMYVISTVLVFLIGLVVWLNRHRRKGLREPMRPAVAVFLAVTVGVSWLGLAFGLWLAIVAAGALLAAIILEFYPRERSLSQPDARDAGFACAVGIVYPRSPVLWQWKPGTKKTGTRNKPSDGCDLNGDSITKGINHRN